MYMTIQEMYDKLGDIIRDHHDEVKTAIIYDCHVIEEGEKLPFGTILVNCKRELQTSDVTEPGFIDFCLFPEPIKILQ